MMIEWIAFFALISVCLGAELIAFYKNPRAIHPKEALIHSVFWILLAFAFNGWIYWAHGSEKAIDFLTGYLVEKSLSIDNLFVFLVIFSHFKVPNKSKHPVLFYGVIGAIVMRALFISVGIQLVESFDWLFVIFGLFLIYTSFTLLKKQDEKQKMEESWFYRKLISWLPVTKDPKKSYESFFVKQSGKILATPLFIVLLLIEGTDLIFALDSVPVIIGITTDPFIAFTSNILAVLGLRALFFALEGAMNRFYLLHYALAFILFFIGCKMIVGNWIDIPKWVTLSAIALSMGVAIVGSAKMRR